MKLKFSGRASPGTSIFTVSHVPVALSWPLRYRLVFCSKRHVSQLYCIRKKLYFLLSGRTLGSLPRKSCLFRTRQMSPPQLSCLPNDSPVVFRCWGHVRLRLVARFLFSGRPTIIVRLSSVRILARRMRILRASKIGVTVVLTASVRRTWFKIYPSVVFLFW